VPHVAPWTPVFPADTPAAILGDLPFEAGTTSFAIPNAVVPPDASGILVFAWAALRGVNPSAAYWHVSSGPAGSDAVFFSLLVAGDPAGASVVCNSQEFWLPMPADGALTVTLAPNDLPSPANEGQLEIHGYTR